MKGENKTNKVTCAECKYGVDVNVNGRVKLCDPPRGHKMHKKHYKSIGFGFPADTALCGTRLVTDEN